MLRYARNAAPTSRPAAAVYPRTMESVTQLGSAVAAIIPAQFDIEPPLTRKECIIEMEDGSGAKMKMAFRGQMNLDLIELSKTFWDNRK